MNRKTLGSFLILAAIATVAAVGPACVAQRPSRNGVFNENQYLRKDFLVRPGDGSSDDSGWFMKATILRTSQPNPLGGAFISAGAESGSSFHGNPLVRFKITQNKLQLVSAREMSPNEVTRQRTEEVVNAWPITNVDLKYRINLDGEKTNFYEENQELDWQVRQWVKVNFDKNDLSDVSPLGAFTHEFVDLCTDMANSSATLVPDSFRVDGNDYMEWTINVTLPLRRFDPVCLSWYGTAGYDDQLINFDLMDRQSVSLDLMYSFVRAKPVSAITYQPLILDEKDPIQHKYGPFWIIGAVRDLDSQLVAARQMVVRFDPTKPLTFYFDQGFPEEQKQYFLAPGTGVKDQTNKLWKDAGVAIRVDFKDWNDGGVERHYGDIRYNFLRWISGLDSGNSYLGVMQYQADPRTGEFISVSINCVDFPEQDYVIRRIDAYLKTIGATLDIDSDKPWDDPGACTDGETMPIVPDLLTKNHNGNSSLYTKMQQYMGKPAEKFGYLGPADFIPAEDDDFFRAYYTLLPYEIYADPDSNPYVVREGGAGVYSPPVDLGRLWDMSRKETQFIQLSSLIDRGETPYAGMTGPEGIKNVLDFLNNYRSLMINHEKLMLTKNTLFGGKFDPPDTISLVGVTARAARRCVAGRWQTKEQWVHDVVNAYWRGVWWHEFGHAMSLRHNFMASVDKPNFPVEKADDGTPKRDVNGNVMYKMHASSMMDYNVAADRALFINGGWPPYDQAAISFVYSNNGKTPAYKGTSVSGQSSSEPGFTPPWKDPKGFDTSGKETQFLYCDERHLAYTPLCRQFDLGARPSEITANDIDAYEWQYRWRNFRQYRKFWNNAYYANGPVNLIINMRRFLSLWGFDWYGGGLYDTFRRIGLDPPPGIGSSVQYYSQLTAKFDKEMSAANQMTASFHKAVIQQSAGERPYRTIYDKFYGDVTQQGIILDKLYAMIGWVGLWPTNNYDPNEAGYYISSYATVGDYDYQTVAEDAVASMIGTQYDVYPYFVPFAISLFAQDTHHPSFNGRIEVRDWIGGFRFDRLQDFLTYFRDMAMQNQSLADPMCSTVPLDRTKCCAGVKDVSECLFDPRAISDRYNEFIGPDKRLWIWAYVQDRNQWIAVRKDRNIASYKILHAYNNCVVYNLDDGHYPGCAYGAQLPMKYFLDSFDMWN